MSQAVVPGSSRATHPRGDRNELLHRPAINVASKNVVSARERRERLLAYHTAVRVLKEHSSGGRFGSFHPDYSDSSYRGADSFYGDEIPVEALERVQEAVDMYEKEHNRVLHSAISLRFVDDSGNVISSPNTPASTPRNGSTTPRSPRKRGGDVHGLAHPSHEIMEKVHEVFSGDGFSYFESKRKQMYNNNATSSTAQQQQPVAGNDSKGAPPQGALPPPSNQALLSISQSLAKSMQSQQLGSESPHLLEFGGLSLRRGVTPSLSLGTSFHSRAHNESASQVAATEAEQQREAERSRDRERAVACIRHAVAQHISEATGVRGSYRRESLDAFLPDAETGTRRDDGMKIRKGSVSHHEQQQPLSQCQTVSSWLTCNPSILEATMATVDLIMLVLMKALPSCLFAGDSKRFTEMLNEERNILSEFFKANTAQEEEEEPLPSLHLGFSATEPLSAKNTDIDASIAADEAMNRLQLRSSQRAEQALSSKNASRLFILVEAEQSTTGNNVYRFNNGMPLAYFGCRDEFQGGADLQLRGTSVVSSSSPRRAEKVELERERRKRESQRPPTDPLQAVASKNHCWLSLTTSKLKQLPLHACRQKQQTVSVDTVAEPSVVTAPATNEQEPLSMTSPLFVPQSITASGSMLNDPRESRIPSAVTMSLGTPSKMLVRTPAKPPARSTSAGVWSHRTTDSANSVSGTEGKERPMSVHQRHRHQVKAPSTFDEPESTILPIVDLLKVLFRAESAVSTSQAGADADKKQHDDVPESIHQGISGKNLQDVIGPVELRLLLTISTAYASLVQSLHGTACGTAYARFLDRHRDQLLKASSEVIIGASMEYLDHFVSAMDGRRGLPRMCQPSPRSAADTSSASPDQAPDAHNFGLLASLRPFGKKMILTKEQVDAILASSAQNGVAGGVVIGNEHDAQRAAQRLLAQNRAVMHEVFTRVKGELYFLLSGVDAREKILEQEQIAIESQKRIRINSRKLREGSHNRNGGGTSAASASFPGDNGIHGGHHGHHGALPRSMQYAPRGQDMVGQANSAKFHAMLDELVGSSSDEELLIYNQMRDADFPAPVFDWQRQNFTQQPQHVRDRSRSPMRNEPSSMDRSTEVKRDASEAAAPVVPIGGGGRKMMRPTPLDRNSPITVVSGAFAPDGASFSSPLFQTPRLTSPTGSMLPGGDSLVPQRSSDASVTGRGEDTPKDVMKKSLAAFKGIRKQQQQPAASTTVGNHRASIVSVIDVPSTVNNQSLSGTVIVDTTSNPPSRGVSNLSGVLLKATTAHKPLTLPSPGKILPKPPGGGNAPVAPGSSSNNSNNATKLTTAILTQTNAEKEKHVRANIRAPESLSVVALQRELVVLERNRRRAGRGINGSPSPDSPQQKENPDGNNASQRDRDSRAFEVEGGPSRDNDPNAVTASVVGVAAAARVERFKRACHSTIQHLYQDSINRGSGEGSAWYEQGRPSAAARTTRASAVKGVQRGRFDLTALTPIAALRLALSSGHNDTASSVASAEVVSPKPPRRAVGTELLWTL